MEVDDIISYHDVVTAEIRSSRRGDLVKPVLSEVAAAARRNGLRIFI